MTHANKPVQPCPTCYEGECDPCFGRRVSRELGEAQKTITWLQLVLADAQRLLRINAAADFKRGAEAMREAVAAEFDCVMNDCQGCQDADRADYIRELAIPKDELT